MISCRKVLWFIALVLLVPELSNGSYRKVSLPQGSGSAGVVVTYIGNEGFMIEYPSSKVLIDALTAHDFPNYVTPSPEDLRGMISGKSPFEGIDLVLVTHHHTDHFSSVSAAECLFNQTEAQFISTKQVVDKLKEHADYFRKIEERVNEITPDIHESADIRFDGLDISVLRFRHSAYYEENESGKKINRHERVQNLGFIVRTEGVTVFHSGDAGADIEEFNAFDLDKEKIDIAFMHFGYYIDPAGIEIIRMINPAYLVLMHIGPDWVERVERAVDQGDDTLPPTIVFSESMEQTRLIVEIR